MNQTFSLKEINKQYLNLSSEIEDAIFEAFNAGLESGYKDGHEDGYRDAKVAMQGRIEEMKPR